MTDLKKKLIEKNTKNDNYNECNGVSLDDMKLLIVTVNNLIKMIDLRIDLNKEEINCVDIIKSNISEIEKHYI